MPKLPVPPPAFDGKKIASIGLGSIPGVEAIKLLSTQHLGHYDAFIIPYGALRAELLGLSPERFGEAREAGKAVKKSIEKNLASLENRLDELKDLIKTGSTLIVLLDNPPTAFFLAEGSALSRFDDDSWVWFLKGLTFDGKEGTESQYSGPVDANVSLYFQTHKLGYKSTIAGTNLIELLQSPSRLPAQVKTVAAARIVEKGKILFVPTPLSFALNALGGIFVENQHSFIQTMLDIANIVVTPVEDKPAWLERYNTKVETAALEDISQLISNREKLENEISSKRGFLDLTSWKKALLYSHGNHLEVAVARALTELGLTVRAGPPNRADIIARWKNKLLVIEVKGYAAAVAESSIMQCLRWYAEVNSLLHDRESKTDLVLGQYFPLLEQLDCFDDTGQAISDLTVKGIIIANTFRETELASRPSLQDRKAQHFPDVLQTKLKQHDLTAITTLQLFGLHELREDANKVSDLISDLVQSNGAYNYQLDWTAYLKSTPAGNN